MHTNNANVTVHFWCYSPGVCPGVNWKRRLWMMLLWNRINGPAAWEKNPWVWALTFKRLEQKL